MVGGAGSYLSRCSTSLIMACIIGMRDSRMQNCPSLSRCSCPLNPGDCAPFPSYWHAFLDLFRSLADPRVGAQWRAASAGGERKLAKARKRTSTSICSIRPLRP